MITDLSKDWRFQHSPPVEIGGIRSYAGTQLQTVTSTGETVVLGSICVASKTVQSPLSEEHKKSLIRAADIATAEIMSSTRIRRLRERQKMGERLYALRTNSSGLHIEELAIEILKGQYKNAQVTVQTVQDDSINIQGRSRVPCSSIHAGLWEDTAYIRANLQFFEARQKEDQRYVRAIVGQIKPNTRVLVVASLELRLVFDDLDAWFIDQCAQIINVTLQDYALKQALAAKDAFLRGITHQLRTPIHGILSSTELLSEELKVQKLLRGDSERRLGENDAALTSCMQTIQQSGLELMTIVNNILRLNAFTSSNVTSFPTSYDLRNLESDVLDIVWAGHSHGQIQGLSIRFDHKFTGSRTTVVIDVELLKELLKCLVLNAMEATRHGSIVVTTTLSENESRLSFDVVDTGIGIAQADQERIFLPFEKADNHTRGAGLGLSLANKSAASLGASLSLVSSQPGMGSHFRLELREVQICDGSDSSHRKPLEFKHLPSKFYLLPNSQRNVHLLSHLSAHLTNHGLQESDTPQGSLIIMNQPEPFQSALDKLHFLEGQHAVIFVLDTVNNEALRVCLADEMQPHLTWPIAGPFFTSRLDDLLLQADVTFGLHRLMSSPASLTNDSQTPSLTSRIRPSTDGVSSESLTRAQPSRGVPIKALIVDDNPVNLRVLQMYCKKRDLLHGKAVNGNEAVTSFCKAVKNGRPLFTLILMDLQMPECDGIAACQRIRDFERTKNLPKSTIFMITGQDSAADRKSSFDAGADEYFVKPVSLKRLDLAIDQYFPGRLMPLGGVSI